MTKRMAEKAIKTIATTNTANDPSLLLNAKKMARRTKPARPVTSGMITLSVNQGNAPPARSSPVLA